MSDAHGVARDQLRAFIERIERLEEEKKTIADDIKDVYGEAKGMGFDTVILKRVITLRKKDEQQRMEEEAILGTYLAALGMLPQYDLFEEDAERKPAQKFQAKASGDNGATVQAKKVPADSVTGDVSRSSRGDDSPATNSQSDDDAFAEVKGRARLANVNDVEPSSSGQSDPIEDRSEGQSLDAVRADASTGGDHVTDQNAATSNNRLDGVPVQSVRPRLRPHCQHRELCRSGTADHCHSCRKAMKEEQAA